ncbi:protein kinase domain-containing protein [Haliangium sp.]|uniref:nSTAND1 domain-containing NTPase n=1 Tax=Haliangium sp. TaxID=2663208 RepID=UPI003D141450
MSARQPPASSSLSGRQPRAAPAGPDNSRADASPVMGQAWSRSEASPGNGASSSSLPLPGARIGQYEIIRELGRGGMGAVFLARDTKLGRRVAIKFLDSPQPELSARFILEARATARCNHENIVIIHEVGEHQGNPFMVLEYLRGSPLRGYIRPGQPLPPGRAVELMVPAVRALVVAHEHNIVHRDLKPDNIFVTDSGTVKVLDFGIAKLVQSPALDDDLAPTEGPMPSMLIRPASSDENSEITRHGVLVGTAAYMSPEQWNGGAVDHRTDIWAAGIILYKMVAGKHPLAPLRGRRLAVTSMLDQPMPSVRADCPDLPDELAAIIDRCLIKDKAGRIPSARALLDALEPLLPGRYTRALSRHESPYPGLSAFQEADADRFFGRSAEIATAIARLRDQPMLGVVGPSGVGKSSFVRAGLMPALKRSGEPWRTIVVRPGRAPLTALAYALAPLVSVSLDHSSAALDSDADEHLAIQRRLRAEPGWLGTVLRKRARRSGHKLLVFIDQFEELYTLVSDPGERLAFTAALASAADDATTPLRLVLSIRSDFLDRMSEDSYFMAELSRSLLFLAPPSRDGLSEAIIEPAQMAGFAFEVPGVIEHMLDHLQHTPGALPLLQFAASKLWDLRDRERRLLTEASYASIGGIAGALASHADAVVDALAPSARHLARTLLLRLVTPERTRAVVPVSELHELARDPADVQRLVDHLVHARLLTIQSEGAGGHASVEIVHESLIQRWPLLDRWLDENQDDAAFLDQLRNAAKQWQAKGHRDGLLWRGEAMEEARRWRRRYRGELPELQRAYLDAVFALANRATRRRRYLVVGVMSFLCLLVAAATGAALMIHAAQKEAVVKAELAERAEAAMRHQLTQLQAANAARATAEDRERAARRVAEAAGEQVEASREQLAERNRELQAALAQAKESQQQVRRALHTAQENAKSAMLAELAAKRARDELARLLERERRRVYELQRRSGTIIEDLNQEDLENQ